MAEDKKDFLKIILMTGIGKEWPKAAYLIGAIKDGDGSVIYGAAYDSSDHEGHAEMKMLSDPGFLAKVETGGVYIILTSNYSPCSECAAMLIEFYNDNKDHIQEFTIQFSRLFRIDVEDNKKGLQKLNKAGIILEAMTEKSWFDVVMQFLFELKPDRVRERDEKTQEDLEKLLEADPEVEELVIKTKTSSI